MLLLVMSPCKGSAEIIYEVTGWYDPQVQSTKAPIEKVIEDYQQNPEQANAQSTMQDNNKEQRMPVSKWLVILEEKRGKAIAKGAYDEAQAIEEKIRETFKDIEEYQTNVEGCNDYEEVVGLVNRLLAFLDDLRRKNASVQMHQIGLEPMWAALGVSCWVLFEDINSEPGTMNLCGADEGMEMEKNPGLNRLCWLAYAHYGKKGWAFGLLHLLEASLEYFEQFGRLENAFKCAVLLRWLISHAEYVDVEDYTIQEQMKNLVDRMMFAIVSLVPANQSVQTRLIDVFRWQPKNEAQSIDQQRADVYINKLHQNSAIVRIIGSSCDGQLLAPYLYVNAIVDCKEGDQISTYFLMKTMIRELKENRQLSLEFDFVKDKEMRKQFKELKAIWENFLSVVQFF